MDSSSKKTILDKDITSIRAKMERSIISMFLRSRVSVVRNIHRLSSEMFVDKSCRIVFKAIRKYRKKIGLDLFSNYLRKKKKKIFGRSLNEKEYDSSIKKIENVFVKLAARKVDVENTEPLIDEIAKYARTDRVAKVMFEYISKVEDGDIDGAEKFLSSEVYKVQQESGNVIVDKGEVLEDFEARVERMKELRENPDYIKRAYTGFKQIDRCTGGLWPGELGIIEGGSSIGKSTLLIGFAHKRRLCGGKPLIVSIEMPRAQVEMRYDARVGGINYRDKLKTGRITDKELKVLKKKLEATAGDGGKLYIASVPQNCTASVIEQILEEYKLNGIDIDSLFVDYLDLMSLEEKAWSEQYMIGVNAGLLKGIARAWDIPVWTPSQTSAEGLDDDMPSESSVGYSRRKFQHSDIFITMLMTQKDMEDGTLSAHITKARDGKRNQFVRLKPQLEMARIREAK